MAVNIALFLRWPRYHIPPLKCAGMAGGFASRRCRRFAFIENQGLALCSRMNLCPNSYEKVNKSKESHL